ncbi:MAG: hypothetical protein M3357_17320 [Actinomycetota bacterium]|nr:hypothetical protein [Actinomycetota bacterium]
MMDEGNTPEFVELETLPPELGSRVMAATAHARPRVIRRRPVLGEEALRDEYDVYALAGDRLVCMELSLRAEGSVAETTRTFLLHEIAAITTEEDAAIVDVNGPSGRQSIAVPLEVARALAERLSPAETASGSGWVGGRPGPV